MKQVCMVMLAGVLYGCSHPLADKPYPAPNTFHTGESFRINLPEDHSKGYVWVLSNTYDSKGLDYIKSVWHGPEKGVDFNFEASAACTTTLTFYSIMYRDTADVKSFVVQVD